MSKTTLFFNCLIMYGYGIYKKCTIWRRLYLKESLNDKQPHGLSNYAG